MKVIKIKELPEIESYTKNHNIEKQYKKVKEMFESWYMKNINFKLRQPKKLQVYQFRITKKYRWFWIFRNTKNGRIFVVTNISDHQDF